MIESPKSYKRDIWDMCLWLIISLLIYVCLPLTFTIFLHPLFPQINHVLVGMVSVVISMLIPIIHFSNRYGYITLSEVIPRIENLPILILIFIVIFIFLSLSIIGGGWQNETMLRLRNAGKTQILFGVIIIVTIGPILEEILWRKFIFEILHKSLPMTVSMLVTVSMETVFHFGMIKDGLVPFIYIFSSLLFFTIIYVRSKLGISIIAHSMLNLFVLALSSNSS